jgi:spermidine synthase
MIPWERLGSGQIPGTSEQISLHRRGDEFSIRVDGWELMNSRVHGSEDALAELACRKLTGRAYPRVLIGGLGMGYTLASALQRLGERARILVAELVPAVVEWNHGPLGEPAGRPLEDERVTVQVIDVGRILSRAKGDYDAVLLDVDNGPEGLTRKENDRLYSRNGLNTVFQALRPAGVLGVWSAAPDRAFGRRLRFCGFHVQEIRVRARGSKGGARHTIWIAERPSA